MPQEAVMIAVDNSDYMRNGDFNPTRLQAQTEAVNLVCHAKRQANVENSIGLMAMATREILSTLSSDYNKLFPRLQSIQLGGELDFIKSIKIAHLALKLRQARHQKMRIVAFVGSPILDEEADLITLAKRLRKEKVSVDIVNFGEDELNTAKLQVFVDNLNGTDGTTSHLVTVPAGTILPQSLVSSPIIYSGEGAMPGLAAGMGMNFDMDGADDPDLLYALRVSMEDQRMRQEAESSGQEPIAGSTLAANQGTSEEAMLQQALALSMSAQQGSTETSRGPATGTGSNVDFAAMSEDEQIALALQMSLETAQMEVDQPAVEEAKPGILSQALNAQEEQELMDADFLENLVKKEEDKSKETD